MHPIQMIRHYLYLPDDAHYSVIELLVRLAVRWTSRDVYDQDAITDYLDLEVPDYLGAARCWLRCRSLPY